MGANGVGGGVGHAADDYTDSLDDAARQNCPRAYNNDRL